jgi:hypothetical protein
MIRALFEIVNPVSKLAFVCVALHRGPDPDKEIFDALYALHCIADRTQTGNISAHATPSSVLHCIADRTQTKQKNLPSSDGGKNVRCQRLMRALRSRDVCVATVYRRHRPDTDKIVDLVA